MKSKETLKKHSKLTVTEQDTQNEENSNGLSYTQQIRFSQLRQAPLPDPSELKEYKTLDKSFPDRIFKMAEKEQSFRHLSTFFGQLSFILLITIGYGIAYFAAINGADLTGAAIW